MRLAISNIAWDVNDDESVANLLRSHGLDAIDVAPARAGAGQNRYRVARLQRIPQAGEKDLHASQRRWIAWRREPVDEVSRGRALGKAYVLLITAAIHR